MATDTGPSIHHIAALAGCSYNAPADQTAGDDVAWLAIWSSDAGVHTVRVGEVWACATRSRETSRTPKSSSYQPSGVNLARTACATCWGSPSWWSPTVSLLRFVRTGIEVRQRELLAQPIANLPA